MANDLTTTDETAGRHDLAWKALSLLFSPTDIVRVELGEDAEQAIDSALAKTADELMAVPADAGSRRAWEAALDERLRKLGAKVLPTAGAAAAEWRGAMVEALSDLPAMIALSAAKRAIHTPFRFVGEVEPEIRRIAGEMIERRRVRQSALERLRADLRRASAPAPALPVPAEITPAGIRAMQPEFRQLGVTLGYITAAEVTAALGGEPMAEAA